MKALTQTLLVIITAFAPMGAEALTQSQAKKVVSEYTKRFGIYSKASSKDHSCWIKKGRVICKALTARGNAYGQLGRGEMQDYVPASQRRALRVFRIRDARSVVAGQNHTCVLHVDGQVSCFGSSRFGQLGTGDFSGFSIPKKVQRENGRTLRGVQAILARDNETCALLKNQDMVCWGQSRILGEVATNAKKAFKITEAGFRPIKARKLASKK